MPEKITPSELIEHILLLSRSRTTLIAIDGMGGAGKSTLADHIAAAIENVTVVRRDDFFATHPDRADLNRWDWAACLRDVLIPLRQGRPGRYRPWDHDLRVPGKAVAVPAGGIVILEGVGAMRHELGEWDLTVWVEAPRGVRIARGIARDGEEMRDLWEGRWEQEDQGYVREHGPDRRADFMIDGNA